MSLLLAQRITLLAAVKADATAGPMRTAGDSFSLLAWCNGPSATQAWRVNVTGSEVYDAHKITDYIARSAAERSAFDLLANMNRAHDFSAAAKRNGVADIFSGTINQTSRTAIFTVAQEAATNAQMALGGSNASVGGTANMAEVVTAFKRTLTGQVDHGDVNWLIAQP